MEQYQIVVAVVAGALTYTINAGAPTVSFYRQNAAGTSWTIVAEAYDVSKNKNLV